MESVKINLNQDSIVERNLKCKSMERLQKTNVLFVLFFDVSNRCKMTNVLEQITYIIR